MLLSQRTEEVVLNRPGYKKTKCTAKEDKDLQHPLVFTSDFFQCMRRGEVKKENVGVTEWLNLFRESELTEVSVYFL